MSAVEIVTAVASTVSAGALVRVVFLLGSHGATIKHLAERISELRDEVDDIARRFVKGDA